MTIEIKRVGNGEFTVSKDGVDTGITIFNGSHGFSGRGAANTYGISWGNGKTTKVGPLASCKQLVKDHLNLNRKV